MRPISRICAPFGPEMVNAPSGGEVDAEAFLLNT
jgi:hypothetical protein